jgi:hypothetical protein
LKQQHHHNQYHDYPQQCDAWSFEQRKSSAMVISDVPFGQGYRHGQTGHSFIMHDRDV